MAELNEQQREAVESLEGPLLVLAGAGSGKTRVVTFRIVNLLERGVAPGKILGLTFTNKAAAEMKERVRAMTRSDVLICTFHSLGARILREAIAPLGYQSHFTIYDDEDVDKVIKECVGDLGDAKVEKAVRGLISAAKNGLQGPEKVSREGASSPAEEIFPAVYAAYQEKLKSYNALDFDDLLFLPVRLFREHPEVLAHYQNRWSHLLIDEYQDTNRAQYELVRLLVARSGNVCVVGDPDQSIYSWRGANIQNILNFEQDYPGAKVVRLEQNYRSRTMILEAANAVIRGNDSRYQKDLWSARGMVEKVRLFVADDERGEADFVASRLRYHTEHQQIPLREMVVFYRTNAQSRVFEDCLLSARIPYAIVGGVSFYQRREVKDILAFLRMVQGGADYVSFVRTINLPKRGLGDSTLEKLRLGAEGANLSILAFCEAVVDGQIEAIKLSAKQRQGLASYVGLIRELRQIALNTSLKELVTSAIDCSGYLEYLKGDKESYEDRKENLDALISKAVDWEATAIQPSLGAFLEELSLKSSLDEASGERDRVCLMTIHNGKGLEFQVTFIAGLEEELFPHINARESRDKLEEERRLFYVGMTRAKDQLYLSCCRWRYIWGTGRPQRPSRFLREIPSEYIEKVRVGLRTPHAEVEEPFSSEGAGDEASLQEGDAVFHKEFGIGVIRKLYEGSLGLTYSVAFSKDHKERHLVAKYAPLRKL
jgi:ATP-dependent DNA helicase UvrD/PcrA